MALPSKKSLFLFIWFLTLLIGPLTILRLTPPGSIDNPILITNFFQRLTGLTAFILLFWQIILGSYMTPLTEKLGGWVFKFHTTQGIFVYGLILIHPMLYTLFNYFSLGIFNPLFTILPMSLVASELWISFGRFAFLLLTIGVLAGYFRTKPFLRERWRSLHMLNYVAFIAVAIHSYFTGTDAWEPPFSYFFWVAVFVIGFTILRRLYRKFLLPKKEYV